METKENNDLISNDEVKEIIKKNAEVLNKESFFNSKEWNLMVSIMRICSFILAFAILLILVLKWKTLSANPCALCQNCTNFLLSNLTGG